MELEDSDDVLVLDDLGGIHGAHPFGGADLARDPQHLTETGLPLLDTLVGLLGKDLHILGIETVVTDDLLLEVVRAPSCVEEEEAETHARAISSLDHLTHILGITRRHIIETIRQDHHVDVRCDARLVFELARILSRTSYAVEERLVESRAPSTGGVVFDIGETREVCDRVIPLVAPLIVGATPDGLDLVAKRHPTDTQRSDVIRISFLDPFDQDIGEIGEEHVLHSFHRRRLIDQELDDAKTSSHHHLFGGHAFAIDHRSDDLSGLE